MTWSFVLRTIIVASICSVLGVLLNLAVLGFLSGLSICGVAMLLNAIQFSRFRDWSTKPRSNPPINLGTFYTPAHTVWSALRSSRTRSQNLIQAAQRFKNIANGLPDACVVLNSNLYIQAVNENSLGLLGLTNKDVGKPISSLIRHPNALGLFRGESEDKSLVDIPSPMSDEIHLELRLIQISSDYHLLIARDTSQENRILSMRQDFIANVSHELRSPLTVLIGYIESAGEGEIDENTLREIVSRLNSPAQRMKSLVDDLLTLTRLEASPEPEQDALSIIDGGRLVRTVLEEAKSFAAQNHQVQLDVDEGLKIKGVTNELYSAFLNLLTNAFRYSPEGGEIDLRWKSRGTLARFEVQDTGVGIAPVHLPRLTERFYRVDPTSSRISGGTGLGLAIVKHVLRRHQSSLQITSQLGCGSRFYCEFPVYTQSEKSLHEASI